MTEYQAYKFLDKQLKEEGIELDRDTIYAMMWAYADMLEYIIATEDKFRIGTLCEINRYYRPPYRVTGFYRNLSQIASKKGCYSDAKHGFPNIKWLKDAYYTERVPAEEYFSMTEYKFTTKARQFRKDCGLPEIPEYSNMTEEQIVDFCKKADAEALGVVNVRTCKLLERRDRFRIRQNQLRMQQLIEEDIQEQIASGIPEDKVVEKTPEEITKKLDEKYKNWARENLTTDQKEQFHKRKDAFNPYIKVLEDERDKKRAEKLAKMVEEERAKLGIESSTE